MGNDDWQALAERYFHETYTACCREFLAACDALELAVDQLPLDAVGPEGEPLSIRIVSIGPADSPRVLLHTSGLHGVEGFAGSAVQLCLLGRQAAFPPDVRVIFVHGINPYGMTWRRRVNESNVDLNRNFLAPGESYSGAPDGYSRLNNLLNPTRRPGGAGAFAVQFARNVVTVGMPQLKAAVATGQYEFPAGLFFGGKRLEQGSTRLKQWIGENVRDVEQLGVIDVHTGLGKRGNDSLLVGYPSDSDQYRLLRERFGDRVQSNFGNSPQPSKSVAYQVRGGLLEDLERHIAADHAWAVCQEFGTYPVFRVIKALRDENFCHHHLPNRSPEHPSKRELLEVFCPRDRRWRGEVLRRGTDVFQTMLGLI